MSERDSTSKGKREWVRFAVAAGHEGALLFLLSMGTSGVESYHLGPVLAVAVIATLVSVGNLLR